MIVNKIAEFLGEIFGHLKGMYDGQKEYLRLSVVEKSSKVSSLFIIAMIFMLMVFLIFLMLCFALTAFLYSLFNSLGLAFLTTAGVLVLLLALFYFMRRRLVLTPVVNLIIRFLDKRL